MMNYAEEFENLYNELKDEVEAICDPTEQTKVKIDLLKALGMAVSAFTPNVEVVATTKKSNSRKKKVDEGTAMHDALENKPAPAPAPEVKEEPEPEPAPVVEEAPVPEPVAETPEPLPELPTVPEDVVNDAIAEAETPAEPVPEPVQEPEPEPTPAPAPAEVLTSDMVAAEWNDAMKALFAPTIEEIQGFVNRLIVPAKNKEKAYGFFSKVASDATNGEVTTWREYTDVPPMQIKDFLSKLKEAFVAMCEARRKS